MFVQNFVFWDKPNSMLEYIVQFEKQLVVQNYSERNIRCYKHRLAKFLKAFKKYDLEVIEAKNIIALFKLVKGLNDSNKKEPFSQLLF